MIVSQFQDSHKDAAKLLVGLQVTQASRMVACPLSLSAHLPVSPVALSVSRFRRCVNKNTRGRWRRLADA